MSSLPKSHMLRKIIGVIKDKGNISIRSKDKGSITKISFMYKYIQCWYFIFQDKVDSRVMVQLSPSPVDHHE